MSSVDIRNIKNWDYRTFKNWLNSDDIDSDENDVFDFKEIIYSSGKECRKDFSSFANSEGGFIIFGVDNKTRKPVGVKELDVNTRIEDFLNPNCLNPEIKWAIIKKFVVSSRKPRRLIYVAKIEKTIPFWLRPHISDGSVYVRKKGKSEPIKSLGDLRQRFFQKNEFIPEDLVYFDTILTKLKECNYNIDVFDIFIVRLWVGLRQYIDNPEINKNSFPNTYIKQRDTLLSLYDEISTYLTEAKIKKSEQTISTGMPDIHSTNDELENIYRTIIEKIELFRTKFDKFIKKRYE